MMMHIIGINKVLRRFFPVSGARGWALLDLTLKQVHSEDQIQIQETQVWTWAVGDIELIY